MSALWPEIDDLQEADKACKQAAGVAFFISIVTALVIFLQTTGKVNLFPGMGTTGYIDAGLFLAIGFGLLRHSRIAAVSGLVLFAVERYFMTKAYGMKASQIVMMIFFALAFIGGCRGAFGWHDFIRAGQVPENAPPREEKMPAPPIRKIIQISGAVLLLLTMIGLGIYILVLKNSKKVSTSSVSVSDDFSQQTGSASSAPLPVSQENTATTSSSQDWNSGERTFRLNSGEVIKGQVTLDDEVFYTVETSEGQKIIIKEDIASES